MSGASFRTLAGIPPSTATTKDSILVIIDAQVQWISSQTPDPRSASTSSTISILLIVNLNQNEYATGALTVTNLSTSRPAIASLLQKYRKAGANVAHVVHVVPDGTPVFTPGTPLADEFEELRPDPSNPNEVVVKKRFPGAFAETNLDEVIKGTGLRKIVLVGYMAHVCVSTTAREAHQKGYEVLVAEDAIGDRDIPGATGEEVRKVKLLFIYRSVGLLLMANTSDGCSLSWLSWAISSAQS